MAELQTQPNDSDVNAFLAAVPNPQRREDAIAACALMAEVTGDNPTMWGTSIVGFGTTNLRYASGRELDWMVVGLSPRKQNLTLYLMDGFDSHADLLARLGKHSTAKSCLYIKRLHDVDLAVLRLVIEASVTATRGKRWT